MNKIRTVWSLIMCARVVPNVLERSKPCNQGGYRLASAKRKNSATDKIYPNG